ncbi:MAG: hypothetical protein WDM81_07145 [Rhizomicrobium sp.]
MGEIVIGNLDDALVTRLKQRAERQGLSLEESVRRTLEDIARTEPARMTKEELGKNWNASARCLPPSRSRRSPKI